MIKITEDQQSCLDLIQTWEPENVRLGIQLDFNLGLGIAELFRQVLFPNEGSQCSDFAKDFAIETVLFYRKFLLERELYLDRGLDSEEKIIDHLKDRIILLGKKHTIRIDESCLLPNINYEFIFEEINAYVKDGNYISIKEFPF